VASRRLRKKRSPKADEVACTTGAWIPPAQLHSPQCWPGNDLSIRPKELWTSVTDHSEILHWVAQCYRCQHKQGNLHKHNVLLQVIPSKGIFELVEAARAIKQSVENNYARRSSRHSILFLFAGPIIYPEYYTKVHKYIVKVSVTILAAHAAMKYCPPYIEYLCVFL